MIILDFVLLIIGILAVTVSVLGIKETDAPVLDGEKEPVASAEKIWSEKDEKLIKERMDDLLEESRNTVIEDVKEQMGHLSNEKIMAVSEYGDQILDKIQKNHSEVVFLYNMLNEKENEIKEVIHALDQKKAELTDYAAKTSYELKKTIKEAETKKSKLSVRDLMDITKERTAPVQNVPAPQAEPVKAQEAEPEKEQAAEKPQPQRVERETAVKKLAAKEQAVKKQEKSTAGRAPETEPQKGRSVLEQFHYFQVPKEPSEEREAEPENYNDVIIDMYKEGRSILDISRELQIGQGEVKFVIDLYAGS